MVLAFSPRRYLHAGPHDSLGETVSLTLPRLTSLIGLLAALATAFETAADQRNGRGSVISRTQFFLQLTLMIFTLCGIAGTTPAPPDSGRWGAIGTTATCEVQGFLIQFCVCTFFSLDMFLSICHVLIVRYNWSEARLCKIEKPLHAILWPVGIASAVHPLFSENYNSNWASCWLNPYPSGCGSSETDVPCERGGDSIADTVVALVLVLVSVSTTVWAMASIYLYVRRLEDSIQRFDFQTQAFAIGSRSEGVSNATRSGSQPSSTFTPTATNRRRSRSTGIQGMLYCCVTLISCFPAIISIIVNEVHEWNLVLTTIGGSMLPLLALFNMMVNFRTRSELRTPYGRFMKNVLRLMGEGCCLSCWFQDGDSHPTVQEPPCASLHASSTELRESTMSATT